MIQLALRSSVHADVPFAWTRSARIDGSATAVIISSSPARNTPAPKTASSTRRVPRSMVDESSRTGRLVLRRGEDAELSDDDLPSGVEPGVARVRPIAKPEAKATPLAGAAPSTT